jgi:hypothetical protein
VNRWLLLGLLAVGGIVAAGLLLERALNESEPASLIAVRAQSLVDRLSRPRRVRLRFTKRPPRVPPARLKRQLRQELNEGVGQRERSVPSAERPRPNVTASTVGSGDLAVFTNTLAYRRFPGSFIVSHTAEPSVAMNGNRVLLTCNWGATASEDGGRTFPLFLDPFSLKTRPDSSEVLPFCCDQLAYYVPGEDTRPGLWVWVVQSDNEGAGDNVIRLQWLVGDRPFIVNTFLLHDLSAQSLFGYEKGYWLDQPKIAATREHLFLGFNIYAADDTYEASYVVRLANDELAVGRPGDPKAVKVATTENPGPVAFTAGATDTMYWAGHLSPSALRVWKWPDDSEEPDGRTEVIHYAHGRGLYDCRRAVTPTARNWCGRSSNDSRVLAGWLAKDVVGFAWNAPANPEAGFPYPYVQVVQLDEGSLRLRDEPSIFMERTAVNYAALVPNGRSDVGGVVLIGGGDRYQTCAAVARDPRADSDSEGWDFTVINASDSDPARAASGDYLGATTTTPGGSVWAVSCMTVHRRDNATRDDVEVRFATFGRTEDRSG